MLKSNIYWLLSQKRWIFVPVFSILMTMASLFNAVTLSHISHATVSEWDILLGVFNDPFSVGVLIPSMFYMLTSDVFWRKDNGFNNFFIMRCKTKVHWLAGKLSVIAITAFVFVGVLFLVSFMISVIFSYRSWGWSMADHVLHFHFRSGLSPHDLALAPPIAFLIMLLLIFAGLFALGSVVAAVSYAVKMPEIGILVGVLVSLLAIGFRSSAYGKWVPTMQMILNNHLRFSPVPLSHLPTLRWSLVYDAVMLIVSFVMAMAVVLCRDA